MANIKSQIKRIGTNKKAQERNKAVKSELKTAIRATHRPSRPVTRRRRRRSAPRNQEARQGRLEGRHPQQPGREQKSRHRQAGRRALTSALDAKTSENARLTR